MQSSGFIIGSDSQQVELLGFDGRIHSVVRSDVRLVLVYNTHENPIAELQLSDDIRNSLRFVRVNDELNTEFIGWPVKFVEGLIVFFDVDGNTHLVDFDKVETFNDLDERQLQKKVWKTDGFQPIQLAFGNNLSHCNQENQEQPDATFATIVIGEKIKIDNFFSVFENGFISLNRFQRKIQFYAKPFLFENETVLGLPLVFRGHEAVANVIPPLHIKWASGSPYNSQGEYSFGMQTSNITPYVEPHALVNAHAKSSFFSGTFVGNFFCLQSGRSCMIDAEQRASYSGGSFEGLQAGTDQHGIYSQHNYLILSGFDYQQYSLSAGFYYPTYSIWGGGLFREISSSDSSPIFRFQSTTEKLHLQLVYSTSKVQSNSPNKQDIEAIPEFAVSGESQSVQLEDTSALNALDSFSLKSQYARATAVYELWRNLDITAGALWLQTHYADSLQESARTTATYLKYDKDYSLKLERYVALLHARQNFTQQVGFRLGVNYFIDRYTRVLDGVNKTKNISDYSFILSVDFYL